MKKSFWHYFQCLNSACADKESVVVDIRTNSANFPSPDFPCPLCKEPMNYDGQEEADANGYTMSDRYKGPFE